MKVCVLLLCLGLVAGRPEPESQITVEVLDAHQDDAEVTEGYFEGDIDLPKFRNAIRDKSERWPNGIVHYRISSSFPSTTKATIVTAMRDIEESTKHGSTYCIRYVERTDEHDYIYIQKNSGCHSKVGRHGGGQELSIGSGCESKGTITHELTHALGFHHEQTRYDRDEYVTLHLDNVAHEHWHDFNKYSSSQIDTLGTDYDFGSIMHYGPYTFAEDKSHPAMSPKPGKGVGLTMGQRLGYSANDVLKIQKLYECTIDTSHIVHRSTASDIVHCNFETDLCGLTQDSHDDFDWTRKSGSTSTSHTGPLADHTNSNGYYVYAEASSHTHEVARLMSKDVPGGQYCVDFYLYQHGSQEGNFKIRAAGTHVREQTITTVSGSHDNSWRHHRVNVNVPSDFHIILQSTVGSGSLSDIAIDDFVFYKGRCL